MRVALLQAWSNAVGAERISPPELQAVGAVLRGAAAVAIPALLRGLYREPVTAKALKWGDVTAISEALRWRGWRHDHDHLPDSLWARKLEDARVMREPVWQAAQDSGEPTESALTVLTVEGELPFEEDYLPRVIAGEHLHAAPEAKCALAIAARTFVLRAMRDHPTLGRSTPIPNSQRFQLFGRVATPECADAVARTRGVVMYHNGRLILANYVAGALWTRDGAPSDDPTNTERWVTYNLGRRGNEVKQTALSLKAHPGNRGCMSQNGAQWLAMHGWNCWSILRFFYGDDIEFRRLRHPGGLGAAAVAILGLMAGLELAR
ncbi:SpoIID/LytB domain-containing protein [Polyangium sp. 6x1]|uniref:SpoIID/LytB domain-containing protein n=1 Tax=Polyangium sp. 6x1 TaxID=3042689 RepID=UPI002482220D|nr:SpoIID/LytB domain-containing protein [Polyangium sp. 6x1]MDI1450776.1 SpoIID/LytB domain-containing protein [Polyangium sp. 6x1]